MRVSVSVCVSVGGAGVPEGSELLPATDREGNVYCRTSSIYGK